MGGGWRVERRCDVIGTTAVTDGTCRGSVMADRHRRC